MTTFVHLLNEELPDHLKEVLAWDFIPWSYVKERHNDLSEPALTALFDAYVRIEQRLDLAEIASSVIPEDSWGCLRCGFCCVYMRPGPVKTPTINAGSALT